MADIGSCSSYLGGNDIDDPSITMRSIWNNGTIFTYTRWDNEDFAPTTSSYYQYSYTTSTVNFNSGCGLPPADNNTCVGSTGILDRKTNLDFIEYSYQHKNTKLKTTTGRNYIGNGYPNPTKNEITIPVYINQQNSNCKINIYNIIGSVSLLEKEIYETGNLVFDVSDLVQGVYYYSLNDDGATIDTKMFIIE